MEISQAIRARRSIRKYKQGQSIPQAHVEQMLEAAMCAPSACNSRPWEFVVVENAQLRKEISKVHPYSRSLPDAALAIVVCGHPEALPDAPCEGYWPQDCAAATENILLEAAGLGYGTCWCGLYPNKGPADAIAKLLDVQGVPLSLIIVGVADEAPNRRGFFDPSRVKYLC